MLKRWIKQLLLKWKVYEYIRYSMLFRIYAHFFKTEVKQEAEREYLFYKSFLRPCALIFDIGAYDGHKTEAFLRIADKVVCCEPDKKNVNTLKVRFRNQRKRVAVEHVALASIVDEKEMFVHHDGSAFNTLNEKFKAVTEADELEKWNEKIKFTEKRLVTTTTLNGLIAKYGKPYFIKIDVEGYELEVLKGLSEPVCYLSLECLLPHFSSELTQSIELLKRLDPAVQFNISVHENLLLSNFINETELNTFLSGFTETHFELIVKMKE